MCSPMEAREASTLSLLRYCGASALILYLSLCLSKSKVSARQEERGEEREERRQTNENNNYCFHMTLQGVTCTGTNRCYDNCGMTSNTGKGFLMKSMPEVTQQEKKDLGNNTY